MLMLAEFKECVIFTTKTCREVFKIQSGPLNCNSEKVSYLVMILPMLERLKQSSAFGLIIMKGNTDLFEKENRMYHKSVFIHTMYKISIKVLIGKSFYLRSVKRTNNLKKGKLFGNTN